jgi:hypothetical protein
VPQSRRLAARVRDESLLPEDGEVKKRFAPEIRINSETLSAPTQALSQGGNKVGTGPTETHRDRIVRMESKTA